MEDIKKDQNKLLFITSFTEFGERYSYYVIQALLIFFLIDKFSISQSTGATIVGTTLSMVYISAIIGGYISDKLIGYYPAAFMGSVFMIIGSYILSISSSINLLYIGLTLISISTGLIKSNISSFIGRFYDDSGLSTSHRDFGFNVFYVGINFGSFFALLFASYLKDKYGFAAPFYSSIIVTLAMFINLFIGFFILGKHIDKSRLTKANLLKAIFISIAYSMIIFIILKNPEIANISIFVASAFCLAIMGISARNGNWKNVVVALIFFVLSIIYWVLYFQIFISILLFIDKSVIHNFGGFDLGSSQFLSVESISVILLGGVMGKIWLSFGKKGRAVSDIDKFSIGFILATVFFTILYFAIILTNTGNKAPILPFLIGFVILAISELSLSAIGLSLMTKIAPKGFVSLYMGVWLVTLGVGGKIAGLLAAQISITDDVELSKHNMILGLKVFIAISVIGIIICLLSRKKIIKQLNY